jgi:lipopolysaccharide export system protein LptA
MQLSEILMNLRAIPPSIFAVGIAAILLSSALPAQTIRNHNSDAPVDFTADSMELQDRADRVVLAGGVTVTQAGLVLKASRLTAAYSNGGGGTDVQPAVLSLQKMTCAPPAMRPFMIWIPA